MWRLLDEETDTRAMEVAGVGVVIGVPGIGLAFVPGSRLRPTASGSFELTREDRTTPPLRGTGLTADEIRAKQPLVVDEGALSYLVMDEDAAEY